MTRTKLMDREMPVYTKNEELFNMISHIVGGAVGVCALARLLGVKANIVIDLNKNYSGALIEMVRRQPEYHDTFISPQEAMLRADGRTLLVVVDTNRPEQVEDADLLMACNRVAVIDHHRVAATYIHNAALGFIEPYASSAGELMTEVLQEVVDQNDILRCEAEALLAQAEAMAAQGDSQSLYPVLAELRGQFRLIAETQRISAKNIF